MEQCETCIFNEHKDDLLCCRITDATKAFIACQNSYTDSLSKLPFIKKSLKKRPEYECPHYIDIKELEERERETL